VSYLLSLVSWVVVVPDYQAFLEQTGLQERERRYVERVAALLMLVNERIAGEGRSGDDDVDLVSCCYQIND